MRGLLILTLTIPAAAFGQTFVVRAGEEIQKAVDRARPGDVVVVEEGEYAGFRTRRGGTSTAPITIRSKKPRGAVLVKDSPGQRTRIRISETDYIVIDGFRIKGPTTDGIFATESRGLVVRNCLLEGSSHVGFLSGFCDDVLVERNESCNNKGSGLYVSNSCRRATIRYNRSHHNGNSGIHMNGDRFMRRAGVKVDGLIHDSVIEGNVIYENGRGGASAAISMDGVRNSIIRNNLLYNNHSKSGGIVPFHIDAGGGSVNNVIVNNTVIQAADGGAPVEIHHDSTGCVVFNNILIHLGDQPHIEVRATAMAGLRSDHNLVNRKAKIAGQDENSRIITLASVFPRHAQNDYALARSSPAAGKGVVTFAGKSAPSTDLTGAARIRKPGKMDPGCRALERARPKGAGPGGSKRERTAGGKSEASTLTGAEKKRLGERGAAAENALRKLLIQAIARGKKMRTYLDLMGRPTRVTVVGASDEGLEVTTAGSSVPVEWKAISPARFAALCRRSLDADGARSHLAWYALAHGLHDLAAELRVNDKDFQALLARFR